MPFSLLAINHSNTDPDGGINTATMRRVYAVNKRAEFNVALDKSRHFRDVESLEAID